MARMPVQKDSNAVILWLLSQPEIRRMLLARVCLTRSIRRLPDGRYVGASLSDEAGSGLNCGFDEKGGVKVRRRLECEKRAFEREAQRIDCSTKKDEVKDANTGESKT